ncbi:hypothetical protein [Micromonospora sp. WMMD1274]|jgi:hypothetical protein|uniref:hypothetical protein n=1 Tax=Micromonospora sp. WMMD1274 TaxID=3404116 RepID=UPI003B953E74
MSAPGPTAAAAVPGRDGLWSRRLLALLAGAAVAAVSGRVLLALGPSHLSAVRGVVWLVMLGPLALRYWRPRRTGRLIWRPRVAGPHGAEPGLMARRSAVGWLELTADVTAGVVVALGGFSFLTERWPQVEAWRPLVLASVALGLGWVVYAETRFTGRLTLTGGGLRYGGDWYPWSGIRGVRRSGERGGGLHLRLEPEQLPRPLIGGRDLAVPDERLLAAIERFRTTPEALAVGLPVTPPEPAPGVAER